MLIGATALVMATWASGSEAVDPVEEDMPPTMVRAEAVDCIPGEEFVDLIRHTPLVSDHGFSVAFFETYYEENHFDESGDNWAAGFVVIRRKGDPTEARVYRMWSSHAYILALDEGHSLRLSGERRRATLAFKTWRYACGGKCPVEVHDVAVDADGIITFDGEVVGAFN